jgi:hypothetical protein
MASTSRRTFLVRCSAAVTALLAPAASASGLVRRFVPANGHPDPRPGITGAKVLAKEQLGSSTHLIPLFDAIRAIPQIVDGIRCNCGCAEMVGFYSLLSCYEGEGMAQVCPICQGQGRVVTRMHKEGKTLDEIRVAIDAQYG